MLEARTSASPDAEGRIPTAELARLVRAAIATKTANVSPETLRCYGVSRETLVTFHDDAITHCFAALPAADQDRIQPSQATVRQLATCANNEVFARAGTSSQKLMACLPTKAK